MSQGVGAFSVSLIQQHRLLHALLHPCQGIKFSAYKTSTQYASALTVGNRVAADLCVRLMNAAKNI